MKHTSAIAIALGLTMMFGGTALAEAPTATATSVIEEEESSYLSWIGDGFQWVKDTYETSKDAIAGGTEWLIQSIQEWNGTVENYLEEKKSSTEVRDSWNTLREGAKKAGEVNVEAMTNAYHTVRDWMIATGEMIDQNVASALDQTASAAGVKEAEISEWYRTVENFVVSNSEKVSDVTREAWEEIKDANLAGARMTKEKVMAAYHTVQDWIISFDTEESEVAEEALEHIMEDAGE